MKKTIIILSSLFVFASSFAIMPNEKVLKSFKTTFNNARQVKWYDHANYYEVSFVQSSVRANVRFDHNGNFLSSTRYYGGQQLPTNILCNLNKQYAGKNIFGVTELATTDEVTYFVKLEDGQNWLTLKVNGNGQMELIEKYKKA